MKQILLSLLLVMTTFAARADKKELIVGQGAHYEVTISTSAGSIVVKLHNETPLHRDNFVKLAKADFYDGILFHRVIRDFMIQAGDPKSKEGSFTKTYGDTDAGYKIPAEIVPSLFHKKGVLAAARDTNPAKESSSSQFYLAVGKVFTDSTIAEVATKIEKLGLPPMTAERIEYYKTRGGIPHLDNNYTIFGEVLSGQNIVDKISMVETDSKDRPKKDIFIKNMTVKIVSDDQKKKK